MGDLTCSDSDCIKTFQNASNFSTHTHSSCGDLQAFVKNIPSTLNEAKHLSAHTDVKPLNIGQFSVERVASSSQSSLHAHNSPSSFHASNESGKTNEHQLYLDALVSTLKEDTPNFPSCSQSVNNEKLDVNIMSTLPPQQPVMQQPFHQSFFQPQYTEAHFNYTSDANANISDVLSTRNPSDIVNLLNQSYFTIDDSDAALRLLSFLATQGNLHILDEQGIAGSETGRPSSENNNSMTASELNPQNLSYLNMHNHQPAMNTSIPGYYNFSQTSRQNFPPNSQQSFLSTGTQIFPSTSGQNFTNGHPPDGVTGTLPDAAANTLPQSAIKVDVENSRPTCVFPPVDLLNFGMDYNHLDEER